MGDDLPEDVPEEESPVEVIDDSEEEALPDVYLCVQDGERAYWMSAEDAEAAAVAESAAAAAPRAPALRAPALRAPAVALPVVEPVAAAVEAPAEAADETPAWSVLLGAVPADEEFFEEPGGEPEPLPPQFVPQRDQVTAPGQTFDDHPLGQGLPQHGKAGCVGFGQIDAVAHVAQQFGRHFLVQGVVFGQEDAGHGISKLQEDRRTNGDNTQQEVKGR